MKNYVNSFPTAKLIDHLYENREAISRCAVKDFFEQSYDYFTNFGKFVEIIDELRATDGKIAILTDSLESSITER